MLYKGSNKIGQVYKGNTKIGQIYKGSTLIWSSDPYEPDYVVYERTTAGTETVNILGDGYYEVYCIAGGGGGILYSSSTGSGGFGIRIKVKHSYGGGSGSGYIGIIFLTKGNLSLTIGNGGQRFNNGGNSKIGDYITTYGGGSGFIHYGSGGAAPTINATQKGNPTLNSAGNSGNKSYGGTSLYNGYGAGGVGNNSGANGYVKIVYKGQ